MAQQIPGDGQGEKSQLLTVARCLLCGQLYGVSLITAAALAEDVTFMNSNDPSFNLATSQFTNTNGTNVHVGAGIIGSVR